MEYVASLSVSFAGFLIAAILLLVLTFLRCTTLATALLLAIAFIAIAAQGGCFLLLDRVAQGTSGDDIPMAKRIFQIGAGILTLWALLLLLKKPR